MALEQVIKSFLVEIFSGSSIEGEAEYTCHGINDEWLDYQLVKLPGFDGVITVSLENVWQQALKGNESCYIVPVIGYETIIKFGDTMQMKSHFTVKLSLIYR